MGHWGEKNARQMKPRVGIGLENWDILRVGLFYHDDNNTFHRSNSICSRIVQNQLAVVLYLLGVASSIARVSIVCGIRCSENDSYKCRDY